MVFKCTALLRQHTFVCFLCVHFFTQKIKNEKWGIILHGMCFIHRGFYSIGVTMLFLEYADVSITIIVIISQLHISKSAQGARLMLLLMMVKVWATDYPILLPRLHVVHGIIVLYFPVFCREWWQYRPHCGGSAINIRQWLQWPRFWG